MRSGVVVWRLAQPAAGADWTFIPSGSDRTRILSITGELTTSATVASRAVGLQLATENDLVYWGMQYAAAQAASLAATYSWAHSGNYVAPAAVAAGSVLSAAFPKEWLEPGDVVSSQTAAISAADQWSNLVVRFTTSEHWRELERWEQLAQLVS
jgi:hypothetical protein